MVESRCAITKVVRPFIRYERPSWISASDSESRLEVASSRIRIRGSARMARAMETRCRWPPDSFTPRSPTMVSYPSAKLLGELIHARDAAGAQNLCFGRIGPREGDVLADRAVEQERVLQHHAKLRAVGIEPDRREIDAVDRTVPCVGRVERRDQPDDGRFAGARRPHQRRHGAGRGRGKRRRAAPACRLRMRNRRSRRSTSPRTSPMRHLCAADPDPRAARAALRGCARGRPAPRRICVPMPTIWKIGATRKARNAVKVTKSAECQRARRGSGACPRT